MHCVYRFCLSFKYHCTFVFVFCLVNFFLGKTLFGNFNPLNPAGRFSGLRKQGPKNPVGRFSGICYGVSKTRRASKLAHVRLIIKWFVYTGRYQATLRSQVEVQPCLVFAQYAIYWQVFVLDTCICVENMAEILSVCEDTDTRFMLWTM